MTVLPSPGAALVTSRVRDGSVHGRELDVAAQRSVRLGGAGARIEEGGELVDLASAAIALHPRDRAERAQAGDLLDGVRVLDRIVELLREERDAADDEQPEGRGEERVEERPRQDGSVAGTAGSTTVSRLVALPDEKESSVA